MSAQTAGHHPGTPVGAAPGRRGRALRPLSAPLARGVSVAVGAALLAGGGVASAGTAAGHPSGARFNAVAGAFGPAATDSALAAHTARLAGQVRLADDASRAEAVAVGRAALHAAVAVEPLVAGAADVTVDGELGTAVRLLSGLLDTARTPGVRPRADVPVPVSAPAALAAAAVDATTAVGVPQDAALTQALGRAAAEVFRLAMRVETLSGATPQGLPVGATESLTRLETVVTATDAAVAQVGELVPLTPLTEEQRRARSLAAAGTDRARSSDDGDRATPPGAAASGSRARLRSDVPPGVTALVSTWPNGGVPADRLCAVPFAPGHRLQCDAAEALAALNADHRAQFGRDLSVVSSYRTLETQVSLRAAKGGLAAVPGTSNHGWGIAVDLGGIGGLGQFDSPGYLWLKEHAGRHGWHHPRAMEPGGRGPQEPWHWEFGTA